MKYCIIGAGGCGGSLAAYLTDAKKDVTVIARGKHLKAMQEEGLTVDTPHRGTFTAAVRAMAEEEYTEIPDVIFVCVKGYSLDSVIPFLQKHADQHTIILPILNIYGTGSTLQKEIPDSLVLDGCIYIAAEIKEPGRIWQKGDIFRVVFGVRDSKDYRSELKTIESDLRDAGITPLLTDHVKRDTFKKYAYVAPMAACGLYFDACAGVFQKEGEERQLFADCMREIDALAVAMGIPFDIDIVQTNLDILDGLDANASTSMQRDIWAGKDSEMNGLVFEPVRMGRKYHVEMPHYEMIAKKFGMED